MSFGCETTLAPSDGAGSARLANASSLIVLTHAGRSPCPQVHLPARIRSPSRGCGAAFGAAPFTTDAQSVPNDAKREGERWEYDWVMITSYHAPMTPAVSARR